MDVMSLGKLPVAELRVGNYGVCVKNRLAEGGFGYVDLVYESSSKMEYVLKRSGIERSESHEVVKKEIYVLQRFAGPHVVKLLASEIIMLNKGKREACLLLEFCPGGHLLERLNSREGKHLPPASVYRIFGQLLLALKPMHEAEPPVTHRDLKLENILFGADGNVRLCDFGSCVIGSVPLRNAEEKAAAEEIIGKETTQMYRAPEMIDLYMREVLTAKTDIWALGCILYTLCFLLHPFQDMGALGILSAKIKFPEGGLGSPDVKTMLLRMLDVDPEARPSIAQLLQSFAAVATGRPLPHYEVPPDAIQRRKEREITAKLREEKNKNALKKNIPKVAPVKPSGPLDCNSVAARRLALKKGGVDPAGPPPAYATASAPTVSVSVPSSDSFFEANFGSADVAPVPVPVQQNAVPPASMGWGVTDTPTSSSAVSGDPWGEKAASGHDGVAKGAVYFDAFGDSNGFSLPAKPPQVPPRPQAQTAVLLDWNEPEPEARSSFTSRTSSHDTVISLNLAALPPDAFAAGRLSDDEVGFSNFGMSPKSRHLPSFATDSSTSSFSSTASPSPIQGFSRAAPPQQQSSSVDFFADSNPPLYPQSAKNNHAMSTPTKVPPSASPSHRGSSYELDLFDTTPGPPVIDFLSLDSTPPSRTNSTFVSRQQADDVLSLFDMDKPGTSTQPTPLRACPDLTKSFNTSGGGGGLMRTHGLMSQQYQQQQHQQLQQQMQQQQQLQQRQQQQYGMQRPMSYPVNAQQRLQQEVPSPRPMSINYQISSRGVKGTQDPNLLAFDL